MADKKKKSGSGCSGKGEFRLSDRIDMARIRFVGGFICAINSINISES